MKDRIAEIHNILKLNQAEFAKRLGMKATALSMMESGKNALTDKNIKLICMLFNVSETWLRTGSGEMFTASPYETEFFEIYKGLLPETQQALLEFSKRLLETQNKREE
jgi:transcriptional regulator with XRE-family HTH domain